MWTFGNFFRLLYFFPILLFMLSPAVYADRGAVIVVIQLTDCSGQTQQGVMCYDTDDNVLYIGNGATVDAIGPGVPGAGDIERVGNCVSGECFFTGGSGTTLQSDTDLIMHLDADNTGSESFQIIDSVSTLVVEVAETGLISTLVGIDAIGAVDMDYGSADVTDHTFITDNTGDGSDFEIPVGSIESDEILDATITADDLATSSVETAEILDATITQVDINDTQTIGADPANGDSSVWFGTTGLIWEGASSDTNEMLLISADIGQDSTITIPDPGAASDTVALVAATQTLTNKTIDATNTVTINASDITDLSVNTDITADLEEEGAINITAVTGNPAGATEVLFSTGANAAGWDATPAIDCTDCTNIPAAADLHDITNVTLSTPGDGAVLCFTGTSNNSVDCTVGGDATATEDTGTLTLTVVDVTCSGSCIGDAEVDNNITIDLATLATTLTVTDNEATAETNAVLFTAGGDLDGGNLGIESDGDFTYNPSTGTVGATTFSGALSGNATTATTATVATTVTITDNEATAETNAVIFTSGGDLDGGDIGLESDGDFTYTPSTGTVAATTFSGALSGNATTATALAANPGDCSANEFANAIASNGDLTCAALVDADIPDTITVSNYLPLAGGTLTGEVVVDNLGLEFTAGDDHTDCTAFAATGGGIFYDDSEGLFKKCQDNVLSDLDTSGAIRLDEIASPTAASTITSDDTETVTFDSASDGETYFTISLNTADLVGNTTALLITAVDNDDANYFPLTIQDDQDGTPDNLFTVDSDGDVLLAGNLTIGDNLAATMTITGDNSGAVDPVITLGDGIVNVSTGELQEGGSAVLTEETGSFTSAVLIASLTNETGSGSAVFGTSPTIATPSLTGQITTNAVSVNDADCTGDQGKFWYDDGDNRFEFCNANSGVPDALGGDVTQVGTDCTSGNCFVTGGTGTTLESDTGLIMALDADNDGSNTFTITDGADATVFTVDESGNVTATGNITAAAFLSSGSATPAVDFNDTDDAGTVEGSINVNCPTTDDCDMDFAVNSGADTETVFLGADTTDSGSTTVTLTTDLIDATGDQAGVSHAMTVNKATSGAAVALDIDVTDTASPGVLYLIEAGVGGVPRFTVDETGGIIFEGTGGDDANETTLTVANPTGDNTVTIPDATFTVVGHDTTQTLTNKTIDDANNTLTIDGASISTGTLPAARLGADSIDALTEIAQGIKTAANDTDPLAVYTGGNPGSNVCVEMNSSGQLISAGNTCSNLGPGGTTAIDALGNAGAGDDAVSLDEQGQTWTWDSSDTTTGNVDAMTLEWNHDSSTDANVQSLLNLERASTAGSTVLDNLLRIQNLDVDGSVSNGIQILSAAGGMTDAIDASDPEIVNALVTGANDLSGTNWSITGATGAAAFSGTLSGEIGVTSDTAATISPTAAELRGHMRLNGDADVIQYDLPAVEAGLNFCVYDNAGGVISIHPNGTNVIVLDGTALTAGNEIDSPGARGDFICLLGLDATNWITLGRSGTWIDGGAT